MPLAYTVTLHHPTLSGDLRREAEVQFRHALELALGGVDGVVRCWLAWQKAEHQQGNLSQDTWKVARQWLIAAEHARQTALAPPANIVEAFFEVQRAIEETNTSPAS